jgi:hypothetical protein
MQWTRFYQKFALKEPQLLVNGYDMKSVYYDKIKFLIAMVLLTADPLHFKVSVLWNLLLSYIPSEKKK